MLKQLAEIAARNLLVAAGGWFIKQGFVDSGTWANITPHLLPILGGTIAAIGGFVWSHMHVNRALNTVPPSLTEKGASGLMQSTQGPYPKA